MRRSIAFALFALLVTGCASLKNTSKQEYVWEMWAICKPQLGITTTVIADVLPDGSYRSNTTVGPFEIEWPRITGCMNAQFKAHPYLAWLKARDAAAPEVGAVPQVSRSNGPVLVPVWNVGDEWEYAYQSPSGSGTYVLTVQRIEALDAVPHYVIKTGPREVFYRVSDLAATLERLDGVVVMRETPPRLHYEWPLAVGKSWEEDHKYERPADRTTSDLKSRWTVDVEEVISVPAGTFRTLKITWRNRTTNRVVSEMWYAPDVKQWVKIREFLTSGTRERELIGFKFK